MDRLSDDEIRNAVRDNYARLAQSDGSCGCGGSSQLPMMERKCCGQPSAVPMERPSQDSERMGYSEDELASVPDGANMGLGCGNPQAIAALKAGETVLDLGSGGGFDCFLAANQVGDTGHVIGVDMTPEMLNKARQNAARAGYSNVEFRLGEIEYLPVADSIVDVILSNCVINLSPDKESVYSETFRVLKPGGRLAISDMVSVAQLPDDLKQDLDNYCGCITGAISVKETETLLANIGFKDIKIQIKDESKDFVTEWVQGRNIEDYVLSATIEAVKSDLTNTEISQMMSNK